MGVQLSKFDSYRMQNWIRYREVTFKWIYISLILRSDNIFNIQYQRLNLSLKD